MKIRAALALDAGAPLSIEEVELTEDLAPHEIMVKNVASGICHSDMTMRDLPDGFAPQGMVFLPRPVILGHEGAGIVQKVGSEVTDLEPGDHVIMSFHYDGTCPQCQVGLHQYCGGFMEANLSGFRLDGSLSMSSDNHDQVAASYHQQSSFATYSIATDKNAVKVPKHLPLEMLGPLGCGFMTGAGAVLNRLKPTPGSSFALFGAGPVGFAGLYMAKKLGATTRIAIDLTESRLELAKAFGATHTINASKVDDTIEALMEICPEGVNFTFEATGVVPVMNQAIAALSPLGTCVLSGVSPDPEKKIEMAAMDVLLGKTVAGICMGHADMPGTIGQLIDAVDNGDFPIDKLITYYDFEDINQAIEDSENGTSLKCVVRMPQ